MLLIAFVSFALIMNGCGKDETEEPAPQVVNPTGNALVDIPKCISNPDSFGYASMMALRRACDSDSVTGAEIYENVRVYIGVADFCAQLVGQMMTDLATIDVNFSGTFEDHEGNVFHVKFEIGNHSAHDTTFGYHLDMWDGYGGKLIEFDFLRNPDTRGVLVFRPLMINPETDTTDLRECYVRISFDVTTAEYDKWMEVSIAGFPAGDDLDNLKMEVYLIGDKLYLRGNSNHPLVSLTKHSAETPVGRNYIFRAMADTTLNLGICEVGIPTNDVTTIDSIFELYAVTVVFDSLIHLCYPTAPDSLIDAWLETFAAPGFFTEAGFLAPGPDVPTSPAGFDALLGYAELDVYTPVDIRDLLIAFIDDSPPMP